MSQALATLGLVVALGGCERKIDAPPTVENNSSLGPVTVEAIEPEYEVRRLARDDFERLEPLHFVEPVGEGYRRVSVEYGPPLHSGKHLRFGRGESRFLGERYVIVTEYPKRPKNPHADPIIENVVVDVDGGEVVATFAKRHLVNWAHGLAIVTQAQDPTPWLFTPNAGGLVRALPEGEHDYVWGENYWLRISPIAPRVWISAEDEAGQAHIYEWEDLSKPPPLPANPVDFIPREWYPRSSEWLVDVDHEEVSSPMGQACEHAILEPPRGFHCLDLTLSAGTEPVGHGWRFDRREGTVFELENPSKRLSLVELCPEGTKLLMQVFYDTMLKLRCRGDNTVWAVWSPPERVRVLSPELAFRVNGPPVVPNEPVAGFDWASVVPHITIDEFESLVHRPDNVQTVFNTARGVREFVGQDYQCEESRGIPGNGRVYGVECTTAGGQSIDVIDMSTHTRARLPILDLAVSMTGSLMAIRRQRSKDHLFILHTTKVQ